VNLEELYSRHGERLFRYLVFRLGSAEDAEDALQEAFCRFARYGLRWRFVRDPQAFVFRVARNEANRSLRRRLRRREEERTMAHDDGPGFAAPFLPPEDKELAWVLSAAEKLPAEQKEIVFLKILEGLTFKEIGAVCEIPLNTAASRYRLAIARLREAAGGRP